VQHVYKELESNLLELGCEVALPFAVVELGRADPQAFSRWVKSRIAESEFVVTALLSYDLSPPVESAIAESLDKPQCLVVGPEVRVPRLLAGQTTMRGIVPLSRLSEVSEIVRASLGRTGYAY